MQDLIAARKARDLRPASAFGQPGNNANQITGNSENMAENRSPSSDLPRVDPLEPRGPRVLDVGCGPSKVSGTIGVDHWPSAGVDVVCDLNQLPWPFADNSFDGAICQHSLAHLESVVSAVEELHRVLSPGAILEIVTPHFSSYNAFTDITSRWFFGYRSMDYFCPDRRLSKYRYSRATFELLEARLSFRRAAIFDPGGRKRNPLRTVGIDSLANRFPHFYERFLAFVLPASEVYFRLRVIKATGEAGLCPGTAKAASLRVEAGVKVDQRYAYRALRHRGSGGNVR